MTIHQIGLVAAILLFAIAVVLSVSNGRISTAGLFRDAKGSSPMRAVSFLATILLATTYLVQVSSRDVINGVMPSPSEGLLGSYLVASAAYLTGKAFSFGHFDIGLSQLGRLFAPTRFEIGDTP